MLPDCVKWLSNAEDEDNLLGLNQVASATVNWSLPSFLASSYNRGLVCVCVCVCVYVLVEACFGGGGLVVKSCLILVTPWTVAYQALRSMGFPSQEYCL